MKTNWSSKLRGTARQPLGGALDGVVSGLLALDARAALHPLLAGLNGVKPHAGAQLGRLREVLDRDRALVAAGAPLPTIPQAPTLTIVPEPAARPRAPAPAGAFATPDFVAPAPCPSASAAPIAEAAPASAAPRSAAEPRASVQAADAEPIRTRTMARLLAAQGHPARALAIYDALMADDPDPSLRAEAERLR